MIGKTVLGVLGWSNKRAGLEFYRYDPKIIPRHKSEWGDLLAIDPAVSESEGSPVIVVVLPDNTSEADTRALELLVRSVLTRHVLTEDAS